MRRAGAAMEHLVLGRGPNLSEGKTVVALLVWFAPGGCISCPGIDQRPLGFLVFAPKGLNLKAQGRVLAHPGYSFQDSCWGG